MTQLFPFKPVLLAMLKNKTGPLLVALQIALSLAILSNAVYLVNQRLSSSERSSGIGHEEQVFSLFVKNQKSGGHEEQLAAQKRQEQVMKSVPGLVSLAREFDTDVAVWLEPKHCCRSQTNIANRQRCDLYFCRFAGEGLGAAIA
jgi:hypothetical protein